MEPPVTVPAPGPNPVTEVRGRTPRSPVMRVMPAFVTVDPASTANVASEPSGTPAPRIAFCAHDSATGAGVGVGVGVGVGGGAWRGGRDGGSGAAAPPAAAGDHRDDRARREPAGVGQ